MPPVILISLISIAHLFVNAQAPFGASAPSGRQLLIQALHALSPNISTSDVTLNGSVHYTAGSVDENGTATLRALVTGAGRLDLDLPSGKRTEIRNLTGTQPTGEWIDPEGVHHAIMFHNLFTEPAWFSPVAAVARVLTTPQLVSTLVGTETIDSQTVQHISISRTPTDSDATAKAFAQLSRIDLYLDFSTLLPQRLSFDIHPDNDAGSNIPVVIQFSDYRLVSGSQIPFRIQRYINNTALELDLQMESATVNTGVSDSTFDQQ